MSPNYAFGFFVFLFLLVLVNVYFLQILNRSPNISPIFNVPTLSSDVQTHGFKEIHNYLYYLPNHYKTKHSKFLIIQIQLIQNLNYSALHSNDYSNVWQKTKSWSNKDSLFPNKDGIPAKILHAIRHSPIIIAENALKGTQLKLLLTVKGNQKLYFKPKRYSLDRVIFGNIYGGFDRHNAEVLGYYLAMVLNFTWVAPAIVRKINIQNEILPFATSAMKKTMIKNNGSLCIYGKCFYCRANETICADSKGDVEGAAILYLDRLFEIYKHPWRRSYNSKKMEWETNDNYCKKVMLNMDMQRLLDLIDISIFDFIIQNGDRHRYELYKNKVIVLDNGKGLGNPWNDELDILAPLYQCCIIRLSTWRHLELLSGGSLTDTLKILSNYPKEMLVNDDHWTAFERRLLKVYATVQLCIGKYGSAKVFKNGVFDV